MAGTTKKTLEEAQLKIAEYGVAEARARKEKAEVELETAKLNQECLRAAMKRDGILKSKTKGGHWS